MCARVCAYVCAFNEKSKTTIHKCIAAILLTLFIICKFIWSYFSKIGLIKIVLSPRETITNWKNTQNYRNQPFIYEHTFLIKWIWIYFPFSFWLFILIFISPFKIYRNHCVCHTPKIFKCKLKIVLHLNV